MQVPPRSDPWLLPSCILSSLLLASPGVSELWPVGQNEPTPVFINKILLGPRPHPFIKVLPTSICNGDHMAYKAKIFAIQAFIEGHEPLRSLQLTHVIQPILSHEYHLIYLFLLYSHFVECPSNTTQPSGTSFLKRHVFQKTVPWCPSLEGISAVSETPSYLKYLACIGNQWVTERIKEGVYFGVLSILSFSLCTHH